MHLQIRPTFLQPFFRQFRLGFSDGGKRKLMALDIVRLVNVRLDEGDMNSQRLELSS